MPAPPLVEFFLLLEQPRQRLVHWTAALGPLDSAAAPALAGIDAYYDESADQALIAVRYDELALGTDGWAFVADVVRLAEVPIVQLRQLSDGDRRRFIVERVGRCRVHVGGQRAVTGALGELMRAVRLAREEDARTATQVGGLPPRAPAPAVARTVTPNLPRTVTPNLPRTVTPRSAAVPAAAPPAAADRTEKTSVAEPAAASPVASARGTSPGRPPTRRAHSPSEGQTGAYVAVAEGTPLPAQAIQARYLRSGRWVAIRVGALSLKGATLVSGALARQGEVAHVALGFATHRALVKGVVERVSSTTEAEATGASSFEVRFELDEPGRRQLVALLSAARAANVTLKPAPPRAARRFPVEWPVSVATPRGAVQGDALDISRHGMFIHPTNTLPFDTNLNFSAVLDDSARPVAGRARVVRQVSEVDAERRGLSAGYGVQIIDMADTDRTRWMGFLARVQLRADKRVLIGASPTRLAELQSGLSAAGYAVTGGTDAGAMVQLADVDGRLVDAAVIDGTWVGEGASWLESLFASRNVPCVTLHGDARRARSVVDRMLAVA